MEPDGDAPPFWSPQPPNRRRGSPQSSPLLNPFALILAIPIILILLFFLLPPFLSHTNQILRPNSVKKSWDSINVLLVLFAILCGVFARRNEDAPPPEDDRRRADGVPAATNLVTRPRQFAPTWLDFPDRKEYNRISGGVNGGGGLRRSSSSYPDLRQEALWESGGSRNRFSDDFEVFYRSPLRETEDSILTRRRNAAEREFEEPIVREIPVDKFEISSAPPPTPPKSTPPPPPPPPPAAAIPKKRRSVHSVGRQRKEAEISEIRRPAPVPPPPPPPQPPPSLSPEYHSPPGTHERIIVRKRSGATKDFTSAIASLYKSGQRKRKKRTKSRDIFENAPQNSSPSITEPRSTPPPPPPPPPPPTPPSKVLQNLFKKSSKSKRVHSVPTTSQPPPPPPPPPPNSIFNNIFKTGSRSRRLEKSYTPTASPPPPPPPPPPSSILNSIFKSESKSRRFKAAPLTPPAPAPPPPRPRQSNAGRPPKPTKAVPQYHHEQMIAPPSPLIPPPPPPPPFRMAEMKFVAQGDFVRIQSAHSSRCSSPDLEDADVVSVKSDGGDSVGPSSVSCPSPDVNAKADTFIARLRDEWRLEKMNSMKEKQRLH